MSDTYCLAASMSIVRGGSGLGDGGSTISTLHLHFRADMEAENGGSVVDTALDPSVLQRFIFGRVRALRRAKLPHLQHFETFGAFEPFDDDMPIHCGLSFLDG